MALFKLRKKVDEPTAAAAPAESIESMRRRARHRLIGAVVLVLAGVIGFPLLFDTQPRPVSVDIPIEIPDRNKVQPLAPAAAPVASGKLAVPATPTPTPAASVPVAAREDKPLPAASEGASSRAATAEKVAKVEPAPEKKPEPKAEARPETRPETRTETRTEPRPEARPDPAREARPETRLAEADKARALLEGRSVEAAGARFVVQVGAFAEQDKARLAQQKLERAGLKNYTHVADTREGKRIRVRAGPFASRAEADRAAEKIKGLDLPAAILTL